MQSLKPFFSYFGSKYRLAPKYPQPEYDTIIEPFAGSAGYSLRYPERDVILVDSDPVIVAIWRWLISATEDDVLSLPRLKPDDTLADYDLPQAAKWLMGFWVAGARPVPGLKVSRFGATNGNGYDRLAMWPERVASQLRYIRHWQVIEDSYANAPDREATWFVDPPYQVAGKTYRHGSKGIDFDALGEWCRGRHGQVIVCENEGADWLPFEHFARHQSIASFGELLYRAEVVWLNQTAIAEKVTS